MSDDVAKKLAEQLVDFVNDLICQTRILIGSFEGLETMSEDRLTSFRPYLDLAVSNFKKVLETGLVDKVKEAEIQQNLEDLEEQIKLTERKGVFTGLGN